MRRRFHSIGVLLRLLPGLLTRPSRRRQLRSMRRLCRSLPQRLTAPLPDALAALAPPCPPTRPPEVTARALRRLADGAAILERRSPLGLCLRRSLIRFHALRACGLPVVVCFGVRRAGDRDRSLAGHAWVTLDGAPYHEPPSSFEDWTVMLAYPTPEAGD